jgi:putative membrane protein
MMGWASQGYGMGGFGGITMIFFWLVIIVGVILVIRYFTAGQGGVTGASRERDPLEILKDRYARGEIGTEEYE